MLRKLLIVLTTVAMFVTPVLSQEHLVPEYEIVDMGHSEQFGNMIAVSGTITTEMANDITTKYPNLNTIAIDSNGGNAIAGMAIGSYMRTHNVGMFVPPHMVCLSSCAFAAMGANRLALYGMLGFHRPWVQSNDPTDRFADLTAEQQQEAKLAEDRLMTTVVVSYSLKMDFSIPFATLIAVGTSPTRFLTFTDANAFYTYRGDLMTAGSATPTRFMNQDEINQYRNKE